MHSSYASYSNELECITGLYQNKLSSYSKTPIEKLFNWVMSPFQFKWSPWTWTQKNAELKKPTLSIMAGWQMCGCCYTQAAGQWSDHWPGLTKNYSPEQRDLSKHRLGSGGGVLEGSFFPSSNSYLCHKVFQSFNSNSPLTKNSGFIVFISQHGVKEVNL